MAMLTCDWTVFAMLTCDLLFLTMKGQPRGTRARGGRKERGAVRGRGARGNRGVDTVSVNASGTRTFRGRGFMRGRGVVSEQQQTQARPKFNVKRGAHALHVIRKTNLFGSSQPTQGSSSQPVKPSSLEASSQPAQSSQAHQGSSSQPQPMVISPKRPRLKSPGKRIRPWRI
ncbi:uncharacterized protein Pyn_02773 [Prunus yedoensis var. nudiflora]|uniref:Uncharacterized protein n=1 Tax=Prunus yedoensis var. nudiflora TaxID=2094558 RepID=A0A314YNC1_PRUYE|nr:uncharacterized protein Pyn_02773 [Prunus yedoensis var. nudiflora]